MGIATSVLSSIQVYWKPVTIFLLLVIVLLSLYPLPELPALPGTDKTHHLIAYCALAFPVALKSPERLRSILLLFVMFGGAIELIQPYVNRYGEWLDFVANTAGVTLGATIGLYAKRKITTIT